MNQDDVAPLGAKPLGGTSAAMVRDNAVVLSEGDAHDVTAYDGLIQQRDSDPSAMSAYKGHDSDATRHDLRDCGAKPETPTKRNRKVQYSVDKPIYALRSRIECFIGHFKERGRIATQYDKLATRCVGFVLLGFIRNRPRLVHKAYCDAAPPA